MISKRVYKWRFVPIVGKMVQSLERSVIQGSYEHAFKKSFPGTIAHVYSIIEDWLLQPDPKKRAELENGLFYTADFPLYSTREENAALTILPRLYNLIFQNFSKALEQLTQTGHPPNYKVGKRSIDVALKDSHAEHVSINDLNLQPEKKKGSADLFYFSFNPSDYKSLNLVQRSVAEYYIGEGKSFVDAMEIMQERGIKEIRIYVLPASYVLNKASNGDAIGRASSVIFEKGVIKINAHETNLTTQTNNMWAIARKKGEDPYSVSTFERQHHFRVVKTPYERPAQDIPVVPEVVPPVKEPVQEQPRAPELESIVKPVDAPITDFGERIREAIGLPEAGTKPDPDYEDQIDIDYGYVLDQISLNPQPAREALNSEKISPKLKLARIRGLTQLSDLLLKDLGQKL